MAPTFSVRYSIALSATNLDANHFATMRDADSVEELPDRNGIKRLTN